MPNLIHTNFGTPIVFANNADFASTNNGFTRTAQLNLTSIANNAARQSDKVNLGDPSAPLYGVVAGIEMDVAPTAGTVVEFYWSSSPVVTAAVGNTGGASGADGAYKAGEVDEWTKQLLFLGTLVLTNDAAPVVQIQHVGFLRPPAQYGSVVVVNKGGQAFEGDAVEMFVALIPVPDEVQ